jgi:hypothetical protein
MEHIPPIRVFLDTNEAHRARAKKIKAAILKDDHFLLDRPKDCPFDLSFQWRGNTIIVNCISFYN